MSKKAITWVCALSLLVSLRSGIAHSLIVCEDLAQAILDRDEELDYQG
ncbi:hypothetical protein [Schaalia turicensis]|nr:hypothetical protein [Schaalia turicensis]QYB16458.1 hypothetical protein G5S47_06080 [Schaalia turicensis]